MAFLKLIRGGAVGREMPVVGARIILGRHPQCEVVLDNAAISRQHAQILTVGDEFFLEDLTSRNGTYLNGAPIEGRTQLVDGDEVQLSDTQLQFHLTDQGAGDDSFEVTLEGEPTDELSIQSDSSIVEAADLAAGSQIDDSGQSQFIIPLGHEIGESVGEEESFAAEFDIEGAAATGGPPIMANSGEVPVDGEHASLSHDSSIVHKLKPGESTLASKTSQNHAKLKAVLEIAQALTRVLEIDEVLPRTLQTLFRIFPQAEQGYILLQDSDRGRLKVKASQARTLSKGGTQPPPEHVAVSMTVVRRAMSTGEALLSANALDDTRFRASTSLSQLRIRSIMCVPLMVVGGPQDGTSIGVIQLDTRQAGQEFDEEDLELLAAVAAQVAQAVENAEMHQKLLTKREMERDLEFATQVQRGFLPNERPRIEGYSFSDYYEAAKSVGGDYYDYILMPDDRIAIVLGDVAGKGVSAALLMARLYASARFRFLTTADPGEAVSKLNVDIVDSGMGARFITFVAMLLDPAMHTLTLANAGHMPPLLRLPDRSVRTISGDVSSVPLGILPDQQYRSMTIDFPPGASVLAFTDGVTEALSSRREMYGKARLENSFAKIDGDIGDAIRGIVQDVESFSTGTVDRDDTCLVGFRRRV